MTTVNLLGSQQASLSVANPEGQQGIERPDAWAGIDRDIADAWNKVATASAESWWKEAASGGGKASDMYKARLDFLNTLSPEQLNTRAYVQIGDGGYQESTWGDIKAKLTVLWGIKVQAEAFDAAGVPLIRPGEPGYDKASASSKEYAALDILLRNIGTRREGALEAAQSYLAKLNQPKDSVSLSAEAVAILARGAN